MHHEYDRLNFMHTVQEVLGILDYTVNFERITKAQVDAEDGNREMVGICFDSNDKTASIYHTRDLTSEDIVHELVHLAHPAFTEQEVRIATTDLMLKLQPDHVQSMPRTLDNL